MVCLTGLTDVVAVIAFVIFMNWYGSLFGTEAFQPNSLPYQDLVGMHNEGKFKGQIKKAQPISAQ